MWKIFIYYNFVLLAIMTASGFLGARNYSELLSAVLFLPLLLYLLKSILPSKKQALILPEDTPKALTGSNKAVKKKSPEIVEPLKLEKNLDRDRRMFLKLIGSAGLTLFFLAIFTRRAHAAFFGSVPGPGTVALKDTTGVQIDPAIKTPTDGYKISQIDDASPAFYRYFVAFSFQ